MKTITDNSRPSALFGTQANSIARGGKQTQAALSSEPAGAPSFGKLVAQASVTVQKGNTLSGMARQWLGKNFENTNTQRFNQLVQLLAKSNGLTDPNRIYVGQILDFSSLNSLADSNTVSASAPQSAKPSVATNVIADPQQPLNATPPRVVIVGDSIAVGMGGSVLSQKGFTPQYEKGQRSLTQTSQDVAVDATVGLSSAQILKKVQKNVGLQNAEMAVISAGTNDMVGQLANSEEGLQKISQNLRSIRANLHANQNVWVLPYNPKASELVKNIAQEFGDSTVNLSDFAKADQYHPRSYSDIAKTLTLPDSMPATQLHSTMSFLQSRQ